MAGTVTLTNSLGNGFIKRSLAWVSDAAGVVSANPITVADGTIRQARIVPGATTPTDLYDVTLIDDSGIDLLGGLGNNQLAASGAIYPFDPPLIVEAGTLTLTIANAGNTKNGRVDLFFTQGKP